MKTNNPPKYFFYPQKDRIGIGLILLAHALIWKSITLILSWQHILVAHFLPLLFVIAGIFFLLKKNFPILVLERDRIYYNRSLFEGRKAALIFGLMPYLYLRKEQLTEVKYANIVEYQFITDNKEIKKVFLSDSPFLGLTTKIKKGIIIKLKNKKTLFLETPIFSDEEFSEINTIFDLQFQK